MAGYVREYDVGSLLGTTFEIYQKNFSKFLVVCVLPITVSFIVLLQIAGPEILNPDLAVEDTPDGNIFIDLVSGVAGMIISAAVIVTTAAIIEDKDVDAG